MDGHINEFLQAEDYVQAQDSEANEEALASAGQAASIASGVGSGTSADPSSGSWARAGDGETDPEDWRLWNSGRPNPGIENRTIGLWDIPWASGPSGDDLMFAESGYSRTQDQSFVNGVRVWGIDPVTQPPGLQPLTPTAKSEIIGLMNWSQFTSGAPSIITDFSSGKTLRPDPKALQPAATNPKISPNLLT